MLHADPAAWLTWFLPGQVTVCETSRKPRLAVTQLPHHLPAPAAGRIASVAVVIGQAVAAGGVAEIDALRAKAEADKRAAARGAIAADLRRLEKDRHMRAHEAEARIEKLGRRACRGDASSPRRWCRPRRWIAARLR